MAAVSYKTVDRATVLGSKRFSLAVGIQIDPDVDDILHIADNEDRIFDEPDWMLDKLHPSGSEKVRLGVRSAVEGAKTAGAVSGIEVPGHVFGVLPLTRQGVQTIVDLRSSDATQASALSEGGDALRHVEAVEAKTDDALPTVEAVEASLSSKDDKIQPVQCVAGVLQAKYDVVLRQKRNATRKVSRLERNMLQVCKRLTVSADVVTSEGEAMAEPTRVGADRMRELLSADVEAATISIV